MRAPELESWQLSEIADDLTMVDGSFDPIHDGHIEYLSEAKLLGLPVLCNIPPDSITSRKHPILVPQACRARVLSSLRQVDYIHCGVISTAEVLRLLKPRFFAKGIDWLHRGGLPDEEQEICRQFGIEIVYLNTKNTNSSSALLKSFVERYSSI
jgi:cytidyltransferase-like protein